MKQINLMRIIRNAEEFIESIEDARELERYWEASKGLYMTEVEVNKQVFIVFFEVEIVSMETFEENRYIGDFDHYFAKKMLIYFDYDQVLIDVTDYIKGGAL